MNSSPTSQHGHSPARNDLWRSVVWAATRCFQKRAKLHNIAQTEIGNFDGVVRFVKQQILWLQIAMHNHVFVTIFYSCNDLLEESTSF